MTRTEGPAADEKAGKAVGAVAEKVSGPVGPVVDFRVARAARKRALRFPWSVGTAPKAAGESSLGSEEEDRALREARVAAWRRALAREAEAENPEG